MHRDTDRPGLVRDGPGDGLADPPGRVGGELETFSPVELVDCFDETEIAFLDEVQEQHAAAYIALGNGDYQTQVGFAQALFGFFIALLHALCQIHLLVRGQKRHLADLLQVHADGIVYGHALRHIREIVRLRCFHQFFQFRFAVRFERFEVEVVYDVERLYFDTGILQLVVERVLFRLGHVQVGKGVVHFVKRDGA